MTKKEIGLQRFQLFAFQESLFSLIEFFFHFLKSRKMSYHLNKERVFFLSLEKEIFLRH